MTQQHYTNNRNIRNNDMEDEFMLQSQLSFFEQSNSYSTIKVFLDEDIREPAYYRNIIQRMHVMQEQDSMIIHIDTYGGRLDGAMAIIDAMENCQGKIIVVVSGYAASAGSIIALRAPNLFITPNARFLCHSASYGYSGKAADVRDHQEFSDKWLNKVFVESYSGFLTDKEMQLCMNGKEYYMLADEIEERLAKREKFQQKVQRASTPKTPKKTSKNKISETVDIVTED